jgi:hypothetical protein
MTSSDRFEKLTERSQAAPPPHPPQWEYLDLQVGPPGEGGERYVIQASGREDVHFDPGTTSLHDALRILGGQGWELAAVDHPGGQHARATHYIFKRVGTRP